MAPKRTKSPKAEAKSETKAAPEAEPDVVAGVVKPDDVLLERVLIEAVCALFLLVVSGALVSVFSISPLFPSWRSQGTASSSQLFVGLVMGAYAAFRVYFGLVFYAIARVESAVPSLSSSPHRLSLSRGLVALAFVAGLFLVNFLFPQCKQALYKLALDALGELPDILGATMDEEYKRVRERAYKMLGLFVGWFVFFFGFEIVVRGVLLVLQSLTQAVLVGFRRGSPQKSQAKKKGNTEVGDGDGDDDDDEGEAQAEAEAE